MDKPSVIKTITLRGADAAIARILYQHGNGPTDLLLRLVGLCTHENIVEDHLSDQFCDAVGCVYDVMGTQSADIAVQCASKINFVFCEEHDEEPDPCTFEIDVECEFSDEY